MAKAVLAVAAILAVGCKGSEPGAGGGAFYRVDAPAVAVASGQKGEARVRFVPREGYHWNDEFPAKARVTDAGGLRLDRAEFTQGGGDFKAEGEAGVLPLPLSAPAAGSATLKGTADFSMCQKKECRVFRAVPFEVSVHVQ